MTIRPLGVENELASVDGEPVLYGSKTAEMTGK